MKFTKPDEATIKRMTPTSLTALIGTLKSQRADIVKPYNLQIEFYERLLDVKTGKMSMETFNEEHAHMPEDLNA